MRSRFLPEVAMTKSYPAQWLAAILATLLVILPVATAAPQNQQQTPAPAPQTPPTTQAPTAPQTQGDQPDAQTPAEPPVPQTENPNVKPGSEADVNAIGDRGVGKGLDFYSLDGNRAGQAACAGSGQEREIHRRPGGDRICEPRRARTWCGIPTRSVPFTIKVIDSDEGERVRAAGRVLLREQRLDSERGRGSGAGRSDGARNRARLRRGTAPSKPPRARLCSSRRFRQ